MSFDSQVFVTKGALSYLWRHCCHPMDVATNPFWEAVRTALLKYNSYVFIRALTRIFSFTVKFCRLVLFLFKSDGFIGYGKFFTRFSPVREAAFLSRFSKISSFIFTEYITKDLMNKRKNFRREKKNS